MGAAPKHVGAAAHQMPAHEMKAGGDASSGGERSVAARCRQIEARQDLNMLEQGRTAALGADAIELGEV